jgi:2,3-bisphosphoglycerate-dependent phosphoglycerate mutase
MTTLLVARHGEADWNVERRWLGHADRPLTERGRAQAHDLARVLDGRHIDAAYASDLRRAVETARIALGHRGIEVTALRELRERDYGAWDGLHDDDIPVRFPDDHARWRDGLGHGPADAEAYAALAVRIETVLQRIAAAHPGATILLVTHGGPINVLDALAGGLDYVQHRQTIPAAPHATLREYALHGGRVTRR